CRFYGKILGTGMCSVAETEQRHRLWLGCGLNNDRINVVQPAVDFVAGRRNAFDLRYFFMLPGSRLEVEISRKTVALCLHLLNQRLSPGLQVTSNAPNLGHVSLIGTTLETRRQAHL